MRSMYLITDGYTTDYCDTWEDVIDYFDDKKGSFLKEHDKPHAKVFVTKDTIYLIRRRIVKTKRQS